MSEGKSLFGFKQVLLFIVVCVFLFVGAELFFRAYYSFTNQYVGVDRDEQCLKELKLHRLEFDSANFVNRTRIDKWIYHPLIGATSRPNYSINLARVVNIGDKKYNKTLYAEYNHNSVGLQGIKEYSFKKPDNVSVRIALFGDSFTCGAQQPLLFNMGNLLEEFIPNSEVLNFCVNGRGIGTMYARYVIEGRNYSPDVVFFNVYVEDLERPFGCVLQVPNLTIVDNSIVIGPRKYKNESDFDAKYVVPKFESYFLKHVVFMFDRERSKEFRFQKGLELFDVMLNDLTKINNEDGSEFFVSVIQGPDPSSLRSEYYNKLITLLAKRKIRFFDSRGYLNAYSEQYRNQSFYFISRSAGLGHYSLFGNALHAQGMKRVLEHFGVVDSSKDFLFANFGQYKPLFLIPEDFTGEQGDSKPRVIYPYLLEEVDS